MTTRQIVINVPEKVLIAEKTDEDSFAREISMLAAVKLYELGRLSSGRAAELASMSRVEFLLSLKRYKVFPFVSELHDLENQHG
jgi:predicted HTH domain antitoxin